MSPAEKQTPEFLRKISNREPPSFVEEPFSADAGIAADAKRVEQDIKEAIERSRKAQGAPAPAPAPATKAEPRTALQEIAERIKKLVHDHGEDFGESLEKLKVENVTMAKALQLWADAEAKKQTATQNAG